MEADEEEEEDDLLSSHVIDPTPARDARYASLISLPCMSLWYNKIGSRYILFRDQFSSMLRLERKILKFQVRVSWKPANR